MEFDLVELADWLLNKVDRWGWVIVFLIANTFWAILHNKSFQKVWGGIWFRITASERNTFLMEEIDKLRELVEALQKEVSELRKKETANMVEIATLKARLERYEEHFSKTTARKSRRKIDDED